MSRHARPHSLGISIAMNEVNIPGPGRGEFIWLEREIGGLRLIKFDFAFMSIWFRILRCRIEINKEVKWLVVCKLQEISFGKASLRLSSLIIFR